MKCNTLFLPFLILNLLSACTSFNSDEHFWADDDKDTDEKNTSIITCDNEQMLIHKNVTNLANNLFFSAKNIRLAQSVAVGTFLPINLTNNSSLAEQNFIGLQIQESFITLATQAGLSVVEFKTSSTIKITPHADVMLSRNIEDLPSDINAQYFLTGTYSEHNNKLMVNARIIELENQRVIAAVTDYITIPSLYNKQKITIKDNMIYRKAL
ncbi:hypothetical protein HQQ94_00775 [Shewanella sp. VB17]|uniref:FlgO family outer membrane protein n=1 Tax=Shewanella sp. VB17 TaxID=2739432 RepID=UPI00156441A9|nr:FlgO family outer membrane protein [Shewanella sp. VB17]NRD71810.1 hypothetical protein [Shewanella sp. VB17]